MLKRFKKFREELTYEQLVKILWVEGIIIAIVYVVILVLTEPWKIYRKEALLPFPMAAIFLLIFIELFSWLCMILILDVLNKWNSEQAKSRLNAKLKEDEKTEVYLVKNPESKFLAHKEGGKIIITLMQSGAKPGTIENWKVFEDNFKFVEKKEKE